MRKGNIIANLNLTTWSFGPDYGEYYIITPCTNVSSAPGNGFHTPKKGIYTPEE
jgi:hypothetical protein